MYGKLNEMQAREISLRQEMQSYQNAQEDLTAPNPLTPIARKINNVENTFRIEKSSIIPTPATRRTSTTVRGSRIPRQPGLSEKNRVRLMSAQNIWDNKSDFQTLGKSKSVPNASFRPTVPIQEVPGEPLTTSETRPSNTKGLSTSHV